MTAQTLELFLTVTTVVGLSFGVYTAYFAIFALLGFKKDKVLPRTPAKTRFAVLIAARNEEAVVGNLVDSLMAQEYPRELFDVIVAPNNCTDETELIAAGRGAKIFHPFGVIRSKGEVLQQAVAEILAEDRYDAVCVIDADNLVHPEFLQRMNDAYASGKHVAQGYRDSKNPADSPVATCYSVLYWMMNKFYNSGHQLAGRSALVHGSGFMASCDMLRRIGGWNTTTMTEDYEFTAQCVLAGERAYYVPDAIIYDEQPLTFFQSWKQRRRWSTGGVQGMNKYTTALMKKAVKDRDVVAMDMALTFMRPIVQMISLVVGATGVILNLYGVIELGTMPLASLVLTTLGGVALAYVGCCIAAAFVIRLNRRQGVRGTGKGILFFALFMVSWVPIMVISMFKHQKRWDPIHHSKAITLKDMSVEK